MSRARTALLWFGLLGAPAAWALHLVAGFGYEEIACSAEGVPDSSVAPLEWTITIALVGVALASFAAAAWSWRLASREEDADPRGRVGFMALASVLTSGLFGAIVLTAGIGVLSLEPCAAG